MTLWLDWLAKMATFKDVNLGNTKIGDEPPNRSFDACRKLVSYGSVLESL